MFWNLSDWEPNRDRKADTFAVVSSLMENSQLVTQRDFPFRDQIQAFRE